MTIFFISDAAHLGLESTVAVCRAWHLTMSLTVLHLFLLDRVHALLKPDSTAQAHIDLWPAQYTAQGGDCAASQMKIVTTD